MVCGSAQGREGSEAPVNWWWAVLVAGMVAVALWWGIAQATSPVCSGGDSLRGSKTTGGEAGHMDAGDTVEQRQQKPTHDPGCEPSVHADGAD